MRPFSQTIAPVASDDNYVAESQTPAAGGAQALTLTAAAATIDPPCHLLVTCAGSDAARTFTVVGTDRNGNTITEAIAGSAGGTTAGTLNFAGVTSVTVDDDTAGAVEVGTADELEGAWVVLDYLDEAFNCSIAVGLSSDADFTYGVETTTSNVFDVGEHAATAIAHGTVTAETTDQAGTITSPVFAIRVAVTSFVAGSAVLSGLLAGGRA